MRYIQFVILTSLLFIPQFVGALIWATWNPSAVGSNLTLSGGNLTVSHNSTAAFNAVRTTIPVPANCKVYWEYTLGSVVNEVIGYAPSTLALNGTFPGNTADSVGYYMSGQLFDTTGNQGITGLANFASGGIVGITYDSGAGIGTFYYNGVFQYTSTFNLSAFSEFPSGGLFANSSMTANFGATAFAETVPTGFNAGFNDTTCASTPSISNFGTLSFFGWF